jgi:hypothetical protein
MKHEYEKLIAEHDRTLSMLRKQWMEADPKDQLKYMERINAALDERLRLIALRDETPALA